MDFPFMIFKAAFFRLKKHMDDEVRKRVPDTRAAHGVAKQSYRYWENNHNHRFNLYRQRDKEDHPLVVDIHGGCWIHGDKDSYDSFCYDLVSQGFTVSTLTYRTIDHVVLKDQIQDIFAYFHFLEDNAKKLGVNLDEAVLTGDSAGAQLSFLACAVNQSEKLQKLFEVEPFNIQFKALALTHPVCYVDSAASLKGNPWLSKNVSIPGLLKLLYGPDYEKDPIYQNSCRPENFVSDDMKFPPVLLVSSKGDVNFQHQTFWLADFLNKKKIAHEVYYEKDPEAIHVYNTTEPFSKLAQKCNNAIVSFFKKNLPQRIWDKKDTTPKQADFVHIQSAHA